MHIFRQHAPGLSPLPCLLVPEEYANELTMRRMFGAKMRNVWISTDVKELEDKVDDRNKVSMKLEAAEAKLIKSANGTRLKSLKKKGGHHPDGAGDHDRISDESGSAAARWIKPKQRPTHKLKFLIGKKVDTINWCRSELQRLIPEVERDQEFHRSGNAKTTNYVMVEFYNQTEAQSAFQMVPHHQLLHMTPRITGFHPDEIIWSNSTITWKTRVIRNIISIAIMVATIVFWYVKPPPKTPE
jgi:calcium permeable stress-gated cation channel